MLIHTPVYVYPASIRSHLGCCRLHIALNSLGANPYKLTHLQRHKFVHVRSAFTSMSPPEKKQKTSGYKLYYVCLEFFLCLFCGSHIYFHYSGLAFRAEANSFAWPSRQPEFPIPNIPTDQPSSPSSLPPQKLGTLLLLLLLPLSSPREGSSVRLQTSSTTSLRLWDLLGLWGTNWQIGRIRQWERNES